MFAKRDRYDVWLYRSTIRQGRDTAGLQQWNTNQLRHTAATKLRRAFGL